MPKTWIERPQFYFDDLQINALVEWEPDADIEPGYRLTGREIFCLYEQLLCLSIKTDGVIKGSTPTLLAYWLRGHYSRDEVEASIEILKEFNLISINDQMHIQMLKFNEYFGLLSGSGPVKTTKPGSTGPAEQVKQVVDPNHHEWTNRLIELGYLAKCKDETVTEFDDYFNNFDEPELTSEQIKTILALFMSSVKKAFDTNPKMKIRDRLKYFIEAFTSAIKKVKDAKAQRAFETSASGLSSSWRGGIDDSTSDDEIDLEILMKEIQG